MADLLKGWERKQRTYKKQPRTVRYPLLGIAFLLLPTGVVAMFTPLAVFEIGSILILTSLTILSFEFDWAYKVLTLLHRKLQDKRVRRKMLVFTIMIMILYAALVLLRLRVK